MKKLQLVLSIIAAQMTFAQSMIVGDTKITVQDFKKDNQYGLENIGIEKSIENVQNFILLQQLAKEKKVDTLEVFKERYNGTLEDLRQKYFYPEAIKNDFLKRFVDENKTERKILFFAVQKKADDKTDYNKVYQEVKSGKLSMEDAIKKYTAIPNPQAIYIKPGVIDSNIYNDIKGAKVGTLSKLVNNAEFVAFTQLVDTRPSLGYLVFGVLSYPNDANAAKKQIDIYQALQSGKRFNEVTAEFGQTENEKKNGGLVEGSPSLPDDVYNAMKGLKAGDYTQPILIDKQYFIFNIYQIAPFELKEDNQSFFMNEMMNSGFAVDLQMAFIKQLQQSSDFKTSKDLSVLSKSYNDFKAYKNQDLVVAQMGATELKFGALKTDIDKSYKDLDKITNEDWKDLLQSKIDQFALETYSNNFENSQQVVSELENVKKNLYSEYIFSSYLKTEVDNNPQFATDYFNNNKSKFVWGQRAKGRVAILSDDTMKSEIQNQIKSPKNWEALKAKYNGKLNDKNQILVHFEEGNLSKDADIFVENKVPFKKGVAVSKIKDRTIIIAIDDLLPPTQMTQEEAGESLKDAVTEEVLRKTIQNQRAKTNIILEPGFISELEKNFKK